MADYNFASEHKDDMRGVFLRLYCENTLADGTITNYTEEDVKKFLQRYWDGNSEIGYALHDKDIHISGTCKKPHFHIAMWRTVRGNYHFDAIVKALPGIHVEQMKKKEEAFAYLIHATFPDKHQYSMDELHLNFPLEQYEEYVAVAVERYKQKEAKHAEKVAKRDANKNMRSELLLNDYERKKHELELEQKLLELRSQILKGELKPRQYNNMLVADADGILNEVDRLYSAKIDKAFQRRLEWMTDNIKGRNLTVIAIEGNGGGGKTLLAQRICELQGWFYSISSDKRDPFQTVKCDDDCFICNDFRDSTISFEEFLRTTEPYLNNQVGSRFHNKGFFGSYIIITTPKAIDEWYRGRGVCDGNYNGKPTRQQFDRRIHYVVKIEGDNEEYIAVYKHFKDGHDELLSRYHNPVALVSDKDSVRHLLDDQFFGSAINSMAEVLNVKDAYADKCENADAMCGVDLGLLYDFEELISMFSDEEETVEPTLTKEFKTQLKQGKDAKDFLKNISDNT